MSAEIKTVNKVRNWALLILALLAVTGAAAAGIRKTAIYLSLPEQVAALSSDIKEIKLDVAAIRSKIMGSE